MVAPPLPPSVTRLLGELWDAGHAAYVVGGSLRDAILERPAHDWDLATDARPDRLQELYPDSAYQNRFGTVVVRREGTAYEITTFRIDHAYEDHRRPTRVEFGDRIEDDLARRDFTVNAMAWGASPRDGRATRADGRATRADGRGTRLDGGAVPSADTSSGEVPIRPEPRFVDPFGGRADVDDRVLRAVGDPLARIEEDALRMVRAVRLAATLDFVIEPATLDAIAAHATLADHLSGERVAAELDKLLAASRPSVGLRLMAETGLLGVVLPELAIQRGIPQDKVHGEDLLDHTLRTVDAAPRDRPVVRLAALLHDIGKPATLADGRFRGHEIVGAEMAADLLRRLRMPRTTIERVRLLVRQHMFNYEPAWSDAAVRRFIGRIGRHALEELFELRAADNVGSGLLGLSPDLVELRRRVEEQLEARVALDLGDLAVNGDDLIDELGLEPGPTIGIVLDGLLERVIADPELNDRPTLLLLAQAMLESET
jgi:putative nucleotidyltransferase with HDIG domain